MDIGRLDADRELERVERALRKEYDQAYKEMKVKADRYFKKFAEKNKKKKREVEEGKITKEEYKKWRINAMLTGKQYRDMQSILAQDLVNVNKIAAKIINGSSADVYAMNANYGAYKIERETGINTSFTLYNHRSVENLMKEGNLSLPKAKVDIPKDKQWNQQKIKSAFTQAILQGESMDKIADRLKSVTDMNRTAAMRTARTLNTGIMNKARMDEAYRAQNMGIAIEKVWIATLDNVTRDSHVDVDGETIPLDKKFSNGLDYPGGMGPPEEVYNCRCGLGYDYPKYRNQNVQRNTDKMTQKDYDEWKRERGSEGRGKSRNKSKSRSK